MAGGTAKPCAACGHNKGQHATRGCVVEGCPCARYQAAPALTTETFDIADGRPSVAARLGEDPVEVVKRHRAALASHATLDDVRKIHSLAVVDAILAELGG